MHTDDPPVDGSGPPGEVDASSGIDPVLPDRSRAANPERRERVLRAAAAAMAERGFSETRIADIAERAGMSPGHVMYYFASKEELLLEALRWSEDSQFYATLDDELDRTAGPLERLERFLDLSIPSGRGDEQWTLWLELWARATHDASIVARLEERDARWTGVLAQIVRDGIAAGAFPEVDVDALVEELSLLLTGYAVQITSGMSRYPRERALVACRDLARQCLGLNPRAGAPSADATPR